MKDKNQIYKGYFKQKNKQLYMLKKKYQNRLNKQMSLNQSVQQENSQRLMDHQPQDQFDLKNNAHRSLSFHGSTQLKDDILSKTLLPGLNSDKQKYQQKLQEFFGTTAQQQPHQSQKVQKRFNAFLKYEPSIRLAENKAHDERSFLLKMKKHKFHEILSPISLTKRPKLKQNLDNTAPLLKQNNLLNISGDQNSNELINILSEPDFNLLLPINQIILSKQYNEFLNRKEISQQQLINEYDGNIRQYPKVYHYLEDRQDIYSNKFLKLLMPKKAFEYDGRSRVREINNDENSVQDLAASNILSKPTTNRNFAPLQKKQVQNKTFTQEELFNKYVNEQLRGEQNTLIRRVPDKFSKQNSRDSGNLPYDPTFKKVLEEQAKIVIQNKKLSLQNQSKLKKSLKEIYSQMVFSNIIKT